MIRVSSIRPIWRRTAEDHPDLVRKLVSRKISATAEMRQIELKSSSKRIKKSSWRTFDL